MAKQDGVEEGQCAAYFRDAPKGRWVRCSLGLCDGTGYYGTGDDGITRAFCGCERGRQRASERR